MTFIQVLGLVILCLMFAYAMIDRVCKCVEKCAIAKGAAYTVTNTVNRPKEG